MFFVCLTESRTEWLRDATRPFDRIRRAYRPGQTVEHTPHAAVGMRGENITGSSPGGGKVAQDTGKNTDGPGTAGRRPNTIELYRKSTAKRPEQYLSARTTSKHI